MTRVAQLALRVAKWTALAGVAFVAGVVVLNLFDEAPSADLAALKVNLREVSDQDNAYLALLGIDAAPGVRPVDEGRRMVDDHEREVARPMAERFREVMQALETEAKKGEANPRAPPFPFCEAPAEPCLRTSIAREAALRARLEADATLVERYRRVLQLPSFEEIATQDVYTMLHPWQYTRPRRLLVQKAALDAQQGRLAEAIHFLTDDLRFWASVIEGGPSLILVMLGARWVREDLAVLSELIGDPAVDVRPYADSILDAATPSSTFGRGYARTLAREFEYSQRFTRDIVSIEPENSTLSDRIWNQVLLYGMQSNGTRNRAAAVYSMVQRTVEPMPANCPEVGRLPWTLGPFIEWNVDWLYNPVGKWTVAVFSYVTPEYPIRLCDAIAHMALVRAQLTLRLASASAAERTALLSRSDLLNPHTGGAFDWAEGARELSFAPMAPRPYQDAGPVRATVPTR